MESLASVPIPVERCAGAGTITGHHGATRPVSAPSQPASGTTSNKGRSELHTLRGRAGCGAAVAYDNTRRLLIATTHPFSLSQQIVSPPPSLEFPGLLLSYFVCHVLCALPPCRDRLGFCVSWSDAPLLSCLSVKPPLSRRCSANRPAVRHAHRRAGTRCRRSAKLRVEVGGWQARAKASNS